MTTLAQIGLLIRPKDLPGHAREVILCSSRFEDHTVPVEIVCWSPEDLGRITHPTARAWWLNAVLGLRTGSLYEGNARFDAPEPTSDTICLVEVWGDCGDDGHLEFRREGYAYAYRSDLLARSESHGRSFPLPRCMNTAYYDYEDTSRPDDAMRYIRPEEPRKD